jgi:transposase
VGVKFAGQMEALRVDIEQSNEPRMSGRRDGGAVVRVERRRHWSDEEKLAILKETTKAFRINRQTERRPHHHGNSISTRH